MDKVDIHKKICADLSALYERKNHDYNDSFAKFYGEFGLVSTCMRVTDKLERLKSFVRNGEYQVKDEKVEDTLMDLANYSIMTLIELKARKEKAAQNPVLDNPQLRCPTCKHKELPVSSFPCSDCWHGDGSDETVSHYSPAK